MSRRIAILIPLVALVISVAAVAAPGQTGLRSHPTLRSLERNAVGAITRALDRVEATPNQRARIRKHLARGAAEVWALRGEALQLQDSAAAAVLAENPDPAELDRIEGEGIALIARGVERTRSAVLRAASELRPEQRARLLELWRRWLGQV